MHHDFKAEKGEEEKSEHSNDVSMESDSAFEPTLASDETSDSKPAMEPSEAVIETKEENASSVSGIDEKDGVDGNQKRQRNEREVDEQEDEEAEAEKPSFKRLRKGFRVDDEPEGGSPNDIGGESPIVSETDDKMDVSGGKKEDKDEDEDFVKKGLDAEIRL